MEDNYPQILSERINKEKFVKQISLLLGEQIATEFVLCGYDLRVIKSEEDLLHITQAYNKTISVGDIIASNGKSGYPGLLYGKIII